MNTVIYKCEFCEGFPTKLEKVKELSLSPLKNYSDKELRGLMDIETKEGEDLIMFSYLYIIKKYGVLK